MPVSSQNQDSLQLPLLLLPLQVTTLVAGPARHVLAPTSRANPHTALRWRRGPVLAEDWGSFWQLRRPQQQPELTAPHQASLFQAGIVLHSSGCQLTQLINTLLRC